MFVEECRRAVMAAPLTGLDALSKGVWQAYGAGVLDDEETGVLCELIAARRACSEQLARAPRRVGSRPRTSASLERRRSWTASGWLPPAIAARFTMGEAAALAVIIAEAAKAGRCGLPIGAIAGRAGVCATTVRNALREARRLGLVRVEERRLSYARSLPNLVTIAGRELALWVRTRARVARQEGGCKIVMATTNLHFHSAARPAPAAREKGIRGRESDGLGDARAGLA
ncbi:transcriptional regulator [Lichenibacterium ramalinae]|uniref:Transcriptional regulator n=1 Tax=Lichenibacterium ramalinae TaxID=2316527 RepID=A0A4Q2R6P1_9HYPH|nr:transcriptional regulator [Lichenibacterium ramalinae]RYB01373.1 transcriptional regulator [Lichenibacterium ramalinae]